MGVTRRAAAGVLSEEMRPAISRRLASNSALNCFSRQLHHNCLPACLADKLGRSRMGEESIWPPESSQSGAILLEKILHYASGASDLRSAEIMMLWSGAKWAHDRALVEVEKMPALSCCR